jgi:hypothetical protein
MFIVTPVNSVRTLKSPPPQLIFRKVPATACWQARYNACCKQFLLTRCDIFTQVPSAPAINQNTILPEMTIFWNRLDLISIGHCNAVLYITSWTPSVAMPTIDGVNNTSGQRNRSLPMATVWPSGILNKDRERKSYLNVRLQQHVVTRCEADIRICSHCLCDKSGTSCYHLVTRLMTAPDLLQVVPTRQIQARLFVTSCYELVVIDLLTTCYVQTISDLNWTCELAVRIEQVTYY